MSKENISVCIATFNGQEFIVPQIKSILDQLRVDDEIIISDDNSTDLTVSKINSINDSRIKIYTNFSEAGVVGNFENALKKSKNDIIFLADQDDIWSQNKVELLLSALNKVDLVVNDCYFIDESDTVSDFSFFEMYSSGQGVIKNFIKNTYLGNCMAFKRYILDVALPFPDQLYKASHYKVYHDVWIGLIANSLYKVEFLPDKLSFYRRHSNNASPTNIDAQSTNGFLNKFKARYLLFCALTFRISKFLFDKNHR